MEELRFRGHSTAQKIQKREHINREFVTKRLEEHPISFPFFFSFLDVKTPIELKTNSHEENKIIC